MHTCRILALGVFAFCLQTPLCDAYSDVISALQRQEGEIEFLKARIAQLEDNADCDQRYIASKKYVAFTAVKTANQENIGPGQEITFEKVIYNRGDGYRPNTSHFIAPQSGVYMFSTSLLHRPLSNAFHGEIAHNGKPVAKIHADAKIWDSGSQTVFIEVRAGDDVWVRNMIHSNQQIHGDLFCSFSGVLLMPL